MSLWLLAFCFSPDRAVVWVTMDGLTRSKARARRTRPAIVAPRLRDRIALRPRHACLDRCGIRLVNHGDFAKVPLTLAVLILQDVALALFAAEHLALGSDFEPL